MHHPHPGLSNLDLVYPIIIHFGFTHRNRLIAIFSSVYHHINDVTLALLCADIIRVINMEAIDY